MNKQLLADLCAIDGVSGHEHKVRDFILARLADSTVPMEVHVDNMGNVIVHLIGKEKANTVLQLDAHMDEVGFIITGINEDGYLRFDTVGGIDSRALFGHRVRIGAQKGVIGGKAFHQCGGDEAGKVPSVSGMTIDIGAESKEDAEKLVKIGDCGTFDNDLCWMGEDRVLGKAVDDRVGCMLLLELAMKQPSRDVWLSFSVQEEIGLRGAGVATEAIRPDYAVAIDATTAADVAGNSPEQSVCFVGSGAVVSFADRATLYDPVLYQRIRSLAEEKGIPTQTKTTVAGGNNAGAMQGRHTGVHMTAVSLPCRYIHSSACMGKIQDMDAMYDLLLLLVEELTK